MNDHRNNQDDNIYSPPSSFKSIKGVKQNAVYWICRIIALLDIVLGLCLITSGVLYALIDGLPLWKNNLSVAGFLLFVSGVATEIITKFKLKSHTPR